MTTVYLELKPGWSHMVNPTELRTWQKENNIPERSIWVVHSSSMPLMLAFASAEDLTAFRLRFGL